MTTAEIQRQYDEVIAPHYDQDPHSVLTSSLDRALGHLERAGCFAEGAAPLSVLDVGLGTGMFYENLRARCPREVVPYGLDLSEKMIDVARTRVPDLIAECDDAANLGEHFDGISFDVICTHFVTGFVPLEKLAPHIFAKLKPGGVWSFVGGTSQGFPELRKVAASRPIKMMFRGQQLDLGGLLTPNDEAEVVQTLTQHGFHIAESGTFEPELNFPDFEAFLDFGYRGGWLTPFIEDLGLQHAKRPLRALLNLLAFPVTDHHRIALALAQRPR